jgi:isopentenyl diphosphate isomerase/L-lactate dehydrogenase-like FMN-dependent dehydrogenase
VKNILLEFRTVMFLVGAKDLNALRKAPALILGRTAEWLRLRGFDPEDYSLRE